VAPKYTEEQLRELRTAFELFDQDKNGHITAEELRAVIKSVGMEPSERWIQGLIQSADVDKNGTIEWEEFLLAMRQESVFSLTQSQSGPKPVPLSQHLTPSSISSSSTVSHQRRLITSRRVTTVTVTAEQLKELEDMFKLWDKDQNGYLTRQELTTALTSAGMNADEPWVDQFLTESDTNRDGMISWPEFLRLMTLGSPAHIESSPTETHSRILTCERPALSPAFNTETFTTQHQQESSQSEPQIRTERIVNPDGSVTTRTLTSQVRTVKHTTKTTQLIPASEVKSKEMSEEDLKSLREVFDIFDQDRDGRITPDELREVIRSLGLPPTDTWIQQILWDSDYDRSGTIEFHEFVRAMGTGGGFSITRTNESSTASAPARTRIDPESELTAAILEATQVDPNVEVEKVDYGAESHRPDHDGQR
jgi:Ca2+-binding EF-hand superfamily protein